MALLNENKELRIIKTARDKESINKAVKNGFKPLMKKVIPSNKMCSKYSVFQNLETGEIYVIEDFKELMNIREGEFEQVIDWTYYYPYNFKSPFAAYLIPHDIKEGERVLVEDLIEDLIGMSSSQGNTYRLDSCEAIWNGSDLEIQDDEVALIECVG